MSPLNFITNAPLWIWPLLALLITFGFIATRERTTLIAPLYGFPFLGILSFNAVMALSPAPTIWLLFITAYAIGAWRGFVFQESIILFKSRTHVTLSGEWLNNDRGNGHLLDKLRWRRDAGGRANRICIPHFPWVIRWHRGFDRGYIPRRAARLVTSPSEAAI